ncbi:hypothetical protein VTG60DRAFT_684 [Thermothelomyces hinnuleus]
MSICMLRFGFGRTPKFKVPFDLVKSRVLSFGNCRLSPFRYHLGPCSRTESLARSSGLSRVGTPTALGVILFFFYVSPFPTLSDLLAKGSSSDTTLFLSPKVCAVETVLGQRPFAHYCKGRCIRVGSSDGRVARKGGPAEQGLQTRKKNVLRVHTGKPSTEYVKQHLWFECCFYLPSWKHVYILTASLRCWKVSRTSFGVVKTKKPGQYCDEATCLGSCKKKTTANNPLSVAKCPPCLFPSNDPPVSFASTPSSAIVRGLDFSFLHCLRLPQVNPRTDCVWAAPVMITPSLPVLIPRTARCWQKRNSLTR